MTPRSMLSRDVVDAGPRPCDGGVVAQVVMAAADGDPEAWDALVRRFSGLVWAIARAHRLNSADSAEVSQAVWLKLIENLHRIREPRSIGAWLASVTRHECLRCIRQSGRALPVPDVGSYEAPLVDDDIDATLLADERRCTLMRAFECLPTQWRSLMLLLLVEPALSYAEIASALDMPIGSIGPIRQRCLARLRRNPEIMHIAP